MTTLVCTLCERELAIDEFYPIKTREMISSRCKGCIKEGRLRLYYSKKESGEITYETTRAEMLYRRYGISLEDYERMFEEQNGNCAICDRSQDTLRVLLHVDHNHDTGAVRALLCAPCNRLVGTHEKYPELFRRVEDYVDRYR